MIIYSKRKTNCLTCLVFKAALSRQFCCQEMYAFCQYWLHLHTMAVVYIMERAQFEEEDEKLLAKFWRS